MIFNELTLVVRRSKSCGKFRTFKKLGDKKERLRFLLEGSITANEWINCGTLQTFFRPKLNGICVMDYNNMMDFTLEEALAEGLRIRNQIVLAITDYIDDEVEFLGLK